MGKMVICFGDPNQAYGLLSSYAITPIFLDGQIWPSVAEYIDFIETQCVLPERVYRLNLIQYALREKAIRYYEVRELLLSTGVCQLRQFEEHGKYNDYDVGPNWMMIRHELTMHFQISQQFLLPPSIHFYFREKETSDVEHGNEHGNEQQIEQQKARYKAEYATYYSNWLEWLSELEFTNYRDAMNAYLLRWWKIHLTERAGFSVTWEPIYDGLNGVVDWFRWEWERNSNVCIGLRDEEHLEMIHSRLGVDYFLEFDWSEYELVQQLREHLVLMDSPEFDGNWNSEEKEKFFYQKATGRFSHQHWLLVQVGRDFMEERFTKERLVQWKKLRDDRLDALINEAPLERLKELTPLYIEVEEPLPYEPWMDVLIMEWDLEHQARAVRAFLEDEIRCVEFRKRKKANLKFDDACDILSQILSINVLYAGLLSKKYSFSHLRQTIAVIRQQIKPAKVREMVKVIFEELQPIVPTNFIDDWIPAPDVHQSIENVTTPFWECYQEWKRLDAMPPEIHWIERETVKPKTWEPYAFHSFKGGQK